ncbi:tetratricopeptide repeat protein [Brucella ciceri]|uniref:tetratricopeptide repeat protein n=1 Tax=Brucella ciceri TaxID=391287 RepID=UPI000DD74581|nr:MULTISPECIES: tetratricopeptide repeat protein [Brucella/Ochrobactrum group]MBA8844649.1 Flp pilus assembly protein TadD [Ochrobactrum sp. RH1CCR137]MBA8856213.1 Flp pilus assembly protein TadD [Ochrobactrum sp. RH1CCR134]MCH6206196.1 tetratricopeptide repeat protein [Brucella ciceri]
MLNIARKDAIATRLGFACILSALVLSGCTSVDRTTTGSVRRAVTVATFDHMNDAQLAAMAGRLGAQYERNPKDRQTALNYANVLGRLGRNDQALAVMRALAIIYPKDQAVLAAYGKALAGAGQFDGGLDAIRRAQNPAYPDWKLVSAEGAILDQMGRKEEARATYQKALQLQPNEPSIISNMGMSYLLAGDARTAETYFKQAAAAPGADSRVRQNLALSVGLQGRFQEAEAIAAQEISPQQAKANTDYLRSMLAQQNSWNMLKDKPKG